MSDPEASPGPSPAAEVPEDGAAVLFDGVCNLCSGFVDFLIPRDPEGKLRFASLQSTAAEDLLAECDREPTLDSVVVVEDGEYYTKSEAVFRVAAVLGRPYSLLRVFRVVPRPLRDAVYDLVARYRYRVFGRKDRCLVPTDDVRSRFLGDPTATGEATGDEGPPE